MTSYGNQQQWGQPQQPYPPHQAPPGQQWGAPPQGPPQGPPQQYGQQWGAPQQGPSQGGRHAQQPPRQQWAPPQEPYQAPWGLTAATEADGGRRQARSAATRQMAIGGVIALVGIVITVGTYAAASDDGGHYFVAYGPAIIGVITFVKGLVAYLKA